MIRDSDGSCTLKAPEAIDNVVVKKTSTWLNSGMSSKNKNEITFLRGAGNESKLYKRGTKNLIAASPCISLSS